MQKKTKVLFLTHPEAEDEVFAAFINITEGNNMILSYQHIGQHSECSLEYVKECKEAEDYEDLLNELVNDVGYDNLVVMNKNKINH